MEPPAPAADDVLRFLLLPDEPGVAVLKSTERRITAYSQQNRALRLARALHETGKVKPGTRVAVIGAGFGGVTAAVALWGLGADVVVYEQADTDFATQASSAHRTLHPRLYDWPAAGCMDRRTELPFLNWTIGSAKEVTQVLRREFGSYQAESQGTLSVVKNCQDLQIERGPEGMDVTLSGTTESFALVVLAVGFGETKNPTPGTKSSYWDDDGMERIKSKEVLISGTGDGGLIDLIRLSLVAFDQQHFVEEAFQMAGLESSNKDVRLLMAKLEELRTSLFKDLRTPSDSSKHLQDAFKKLKQMHGEAYALVLEAVRRKLRPPSTRLDLTLNGTHRNYLSKQASMLHLFLAHILRELGTFSYTQGKIDVKADGAQFKVTFTREKVGSTAKKTVKHFAHVLVRHGPHPQTEGDVGDLLASHKRRMEELEGPNSQYDFREDTFGKPLSKEELAWWAGNVSQPALKAVIGTREAKAAPKSATPVALGGTASTPALASAPPSSSSPQTGLGSTLKPNNLPFLSLGALFVGREDFLKQLRQKLTAPVVAGHVAAITQPAAIHALGGQGKTRAALEYAWHHQENYDALLFVSAASPEQLRKEVADLCDLLRLPPEVAPDDDEPRRCQAALDWLQAHPSWLLLIDNVDSPEAAKEVYALLPRLTRGHVVITSRLSEWHHAVQSLALQVLAPEAGADLILKTTQGSRVAQPDDASLAGDISTDLGHFALGLQQAAAYINRRHIKLSTYRTEWQQKRAEVIERSGTLHDYPTELLATWDVTFAQMNVPARALLERLCWLAPQPLPRSFVAQIPLSDSTDPLEALAELLSWHFLESVEGSEDVKAHLMVQEITRQHLTARGEALPALEAVLEPLVAATGLDAQDVRTWPTLDPLRPHFTEACHHAATHGKYEATVSMENQLARLYHNRALHREGEPHFREALRLAEHNLGAQHPLTSTSLNNLAQLFRATNRLAEAEPLMRRALQIDEASFGAHHPAVAVPLNNLAQLFRATNRLAKAEPLMRRVVEIFEMAFGPEHPRVATALNNLAQLLQDTNRLTEAEPLMRRALQIDEASFGADHPNVATALNNLAQLLQATNRLAEAEPLMRHALRIDEASFGSHHPNVAVDLNNLAMLLQATNRLAEAEPLVRRALQIDETSFGLEHPEVAVDLNNLAQLLQATNRLAEAEPLMRRALQIDEASFGSDHPSIATGLNNLAQLLQATNRLAEAEPLMRRALQIDEASFGSDHPSIATGLNNLALLLKATHRLAEAEPLSRRHLEIFVKFNHATGHEHPHFQAAIENYRGLLTARGLKKTAIEKEVRAVLEGGSE